ncbi:MAG: ABC transporter permease [Fermentimonas sp.]|jgi:putative ABC transport system permease protein
MKLFDKDIWQEIWVTITHNKSRSLLTAFGVFWGMLMLVLMVGAGNALKNGMNSQLEGVATNSAFFASNLTSMPYKGFQKGRYWNIINRDIPIIKDRTEELEYISPVLYGNSYENSVVRNNRHGSYPMRGCYPEYDKIEKSLMLWGRYINDIDIEEKRKVCVIGERIYDVLFNDGEDPIGQQISVTGIHFTVIGVARGAAGVNINGRTDETVVLPFSTMQQAFNMGNMVSMMAVTAKPRVEVSKLQNRIEELLKQLHSIAPDDDEAVFSMNLEQQFKMFSNLELGIVALIWIVGLGTLLAGAVGVSNIMLVTVRERTKEIGIRRALGATPRNIIGQILSESVVLTIIAGIFGIIIGVGLLRVSGIVLNSSDNFIKDPQISFNTAAFALIVLAVIGTLAGYMPAKRAMMIKPVEAIAEE